MLATENFDIKFTTRKVSAWGGLALLKQMMVSIWSGATVGGPSYGILCLGKRCLLSQLSVRREWQVQ